MPGSYERFLFGFDAGTLATASHPDTNGSNGVKCVASGGHFLASGGNDDQIHLYDMKHDQDLGFLMNPGEGAVPCLQFFCPQGPGLSAVPEQLATAASDGSLKVWDMRQLSSSRGDGTQPSPAPPPCLAEANTDCQ
ncbi:uncharacterized protein HaLaN_13003 [Haematococcus lacustris]|uniref:WD_REPEATS_REGION domain-containing protein n=1 Tax=Haematococcus lacustris TaxID=44745 RepID=A0A699Z200_HAELA|nr:uncharacterized protein HaLaN_13003 [Haematococcus lacustris]